MQETDKEQGWMRYRGEWDTGVYEQLSLGGGSPHHRKMEWGSSLLQYVLSLPVFRWWGKTQALSHSTWMTGLLRATPSPSGSMVFMESHSSGESVTLGQGEASTELVGNRLLAPRNILNAVFMDPAGSPHQDSALVTSKWPAQSYPIRSCSCHPVTNSPLSSGVHGITSRWSTKESGQRQSSDAHVPILGTCEHATQQGWLRTQGIGL